MSQKNFPKLYLCPVCKWMQSGKFKFCKRCGEKKHDNIQETSAKAL